MRKNINKTIITFVLLITTMFAISGCKKVDVGITYNVNTGNKVTVYCANKDLDFRPELPFSILDKKTTIAQGNFIPLEQYDAYIEGLKNPLESVTVYQLETPKENIIYSFYSYVESEKIEYNYIIKIKDSNTALVFGSTVSKEAAEKAFDALKLIIQK